MRYEQKLAFIRKEMQLCGTIIEAGPTAENIDEHYVEKTKDRLIELIKVETLLQIEKHLSKKE